MITLEDILRKYDFAPKKRAVFRKKRIWVDDLPDDMTKTGHKAYSKLIHFVYDLGKLTSEDIRKMLEDPVRKPSSYKAPAYGLYLKKVFY